MSSQPPVPVPGVQLSACLQLACHALLAQHFNRQMLDMQQGTSMSGKEGNSYRVPSNLPPPGFGGTLPG